METNIFMYIANSLFVVGGVAAAMNVNSKVLIGIIGSLFFCMAIALSIEWGLI